jgi:hypothetical protein
MTPLPIVFLVDVDNTLIDNDRIQNDLKRHLEREFGAACRDRYWAILEQLFTDLGYRDYLGAECPPADVTVERIGDLLNIDLSALLAGQHSVPIFTKVAK